MTKWQTIFWSNYQMCVICSAIDQHNAGGWIWLGMGVVSLIVFYTTKP